MKALTLIFIYVLGHQAHAALATYQNDVRAGHSDYVCESQPESAFECRFHVANGSVTTEKHITIPNVRQPVNLVVAHTFFCALTADDVLCWTSEPGDRGRFAIAVVPKVKNPRQISGYGDTICALDDAGAKCWAYPQGAKTVMQQPTILSLPALKNPRMISTDSKMTCAVDSEGGKCWKTDDFNQPVLQNTLSYENKYHTLDGIAVDNEFMCVGEKSQAYFPIKRCYSLDGNKTAYRYPRDFEIQWVAVVNLRTPAFNLDQLEFFNDLLIKVSSPVRSRFFKLMKETAFKVDIGQAARYRSTPEERDKSLYLILKLMAPAIESVDSPYFADKLLPAYKKSLLDIETPMGMNDITNIQRWKRNREIALRTLHAALTTLTEFVPIDGKQAYAQLPRLIGQAMLDPKNQIDLDAGLDQLEPQLQVLESNPKAAFLVGVIHNAHAFVRGWVWEH